MTTKKIEEQKNLIAACLERFAQAENERNDAVEEQKAINEKIQGILNREHEIEDEIYNLERAVVAEISAEELFNELNALDSDPDIVKNPNPKFSTEFNASLAGYIDSIDENLMLAQKRHSVKQFDFTTTIVTKARTYQLFSRYPAEELINGKPIYQYLQIVERVNNTLWGSYIDFGFDEDFYKNFKVRLTIAQMKTFPNLETAIINILKRHEKTENV